MKAIIKSQPEPESKLTTSDMKVGDVGVLAETAWPGKGKLILKTFDEYVLLNDPTHTWDTEPAFPLSSILAKGTVIEITI